MNRFRALTRLAGIAAAVALGAAASGPLPTGAQVTAQAMGPLSIGCVDDNASFSGHAYCLDGSHPAALTGLAAGPKDDELRRLQGLEELNGWQVPTRCDGNGTSGKRVQLVYVHGAGSPSIAKTSLPFILQRLVPGANGVFEHSSNGRRAIRWVTTKKAGACLPTVITATVSKAALNKGLPFDNIVRAMAKGNRQLGRTDRSYLVLVDTKDHPFGFPFSDCGLGDVKYDARKSAANWSNLGPSYAMVWANCWTGLIAAHELAHTMGAVQTNAPHHTDENHCWDGKDAMCYPDGSRQKQRLVCKKPDDFRLLDCNGDDYFALAPRRGSYLASHWNSADSQFLIHSAPKALPQRPAKPSSMTVDIVDATHLQVSWTAGPEPRGAVTSWTVSVSSPKGGAYRLPLGYSFTGPPRLTVVGASARTAVVEVTHDFTQGISVYATNASGDGEPYGPVVTGSGSPPTPIVASFLADGTGGGYVNWTGGLSDPDVTTCIAVLLNGHRVDPAEPGETLENTTDPDGNCFSDSPGTYVVVAPTDVLEVYARNDFGVTRVTVDHSTVPAA